MQVNFDLALVDADSIIYQVAHTNSSSLLACKAYDDYISNLIKHTEAPGAFVFIKGDNNFRQQYEQYKANRVPHIDPVVQKRVEDVYEHAREYCVESDDGEADDYVCFHANIAMQEGQSAIIVHIDKDLNCIPGWHYNFRKGTSYSVSLREAYEFQIMQLLQGDATDNIKGIKGVGPKTAEKIIAGVEPESLWDLLEHTWASKMGRHWKNLFVDCANMIYLREAQADLRKLDYDELKERLSWKIPPDTGLHSVQDPKVPLDSFTPSSDPPKETTSEESR